MAEYNDLETSKNVRRMLKTLGVTTYIPEAVALDALHTSGHNPVSFLTGINDLVLSKTSSNQNNIHKDGNVVAKTLPEWPFSF